jgi:hypothetical protein
MSSTLPASTPYVRIGICRRYCDGAMMRSAQLHQRFCSARVSFTFQP